MYNKINEKDLTNMLNQVFCINIDFFNLVPDKILEIIKLRNENFKNFKIENWDEFENGSINIEDDKFIKMMFPNDNLRNELIYIITDECFSSKESFVIEFNKIQEFTKETYPKIFNMPLFQVNDLIMIIPENKFISILHHSGYVFHYEKNNK